MAQADIIYTPDPDAESISSDVAEYNGVLVTTQIPTTPMAAWNWAASSSRASAPCRR